MDFFSLPIEIGSKILDLLDIKTRINVYNSCHELRDYFRTWCRLKTLNLSRSTLATAKTLKETIFSDLGHHILELNLSGIPDLTVDNLKPYVKQFVNLKALDVTFTNIYLVDISDICPENLKCIGINFFIKSGSQDDRIPIESKNIFKEKQFEIVHFVVTELGLSAVPLNFLKDVPFIKDLKLTLADNYKDFLSVSNEEMNSNGINQIEINFNKLTVEARDCAVTHKLSKELDGVSRLNFEHLEYIFMMYLERIEIYVSPLLAKLFTVCCYDLKIEVNKYLPLNFMLDGNIIFKAWNKNTTNFDDEFYKKLLVELKDYLPTYCCMHANCLMKICETSSTWFCMDKVENMDRIPELPDKITLNNFCRKGGLLLKCRYPINLSQSLKLENLTFLTINNIPIRKEFFTLLFECCARLVTLVLYLEDRGMVRSYIRSLTKSIHLAKLHNFMLTSENIQYDTIFGILNQCSSLENIHICEYERELSDKFIDPRNILLFIENCKDLYSFFIEADMSAEALTMMMAPLQATAQRLERNHLCIEVCSLHWGWNPFADVFSPSPLHIFN